MSFSWFFRALFLSVALGVVLTAVALAVKPALLEQVLVAKQTLTQADALVVMAGSRLERVPAALKLYRLGWAPRILLTNDGVIGRWSSEYQRNLSNAEWAQEYLLEQGVPTEAIKVLEFTKSGSYFDALNTWDFVLSDGCLGSLLVVTSDYHTRRTLWSFRRVFAGTDVTIGVYPVLKDSNYRGRRLRVMTVELMKLIYYQLRYRLFPAW